MYKNADQLSKMEAIKKLLAGIIDNTIVLDVGSAEGWYTIWIANLAHFTVGIDLSLPKLKRAALEAKAENISYVLADWDHLPFVDDVFDVALWTEGPEHSLDPPKTLNEIYNVLRSESFLLVSAPVTFESLYDKFVRKPLMLRRKTWEVKEENSTKIRDPFDELWDGHVSAFTPSSFKKMLINQNFRIKKNIGQNLPRFDLPFRKTLRKMYKRKKRKFRLSYLFFLAKKQANR